MTDLAGLIERLEGATGPDREIDALIVAHMNRALLRPYPPATDFGPSNKWQFWSLDGAHFLGNESTRGFEVKPVTASLDAALAFAKRFGFYVRLEPRFHIDGERVDFISYAIRPRWADYTPLDDWFDVGEGRHADQALAILIAALKALQEREGEGRATDML